MASEELEESEELVMNVIQHENRGRVFVIEKRLIPEIEENEVLIEVVATSVTDFDMFRQWRTSVEKELNPLLGMECSGTIKKVGSEVYRFNEGDKVCAVLRGGGYADYVAVDSRQVLPIPMGISLVDAASLPYDACFVWYSLFMKGKLRERSTIMIHRGCDDYGVLAIKLAKSKNCTIFTTTKGIDEAAYCKKVGADYCFQQHHTGYGELVDYVLDKTNGRGVDFIFDTSGKGVSENIKMLAKHGTLVISAFGDNLRKDEWDFKSIAFKQVKVIGVSCNSLSPAAMYDIVQDVTDKLWPLIHELDVRGGIYHIYKFEDASKAYRAKTFRTNEGKKILLTPDSELANPEPDHQPLPVRQAIIFHLVFMAIVAFFLEFSKPG